MRVVLIECGKSHGEVLLPQIQILQSAGHQFQCVVSPAHRAVLHAYSRDFSLEQGGAHSAGSMGVLATADPDAHALVRWFVARSLAQQVLNQDPDWVVFNTLEDHWVQPLSFWLGHRPRQAAVLHRTVKLHASSRVRATARRMDRIFVLNDHMLDSLPLGFRKKTSTFYPIHLVEQAKRLVVPPNIHIGPVQVCIPGQLEFKRRDYQLLLEQDSASSEIETPTFRVRWNCLGSSEHSHGDGGAFSQLVARARGCDEFQTYPGFLDDAFYWSELHKCSFILPLMTPRTPKFESYLRGQITGAYNLAFTLARPLLLHEAFREFADFRDTAFFYSLEPGHLRSVIQEAACNPQAWLEKAEAIRRNTRWTLEESGGLADQYLGALGLR